jgi:hypothetical protein
LSLSFINDEALASELAGYFFLTINKKEKALHHFTHAYEKYSEWGADGKSNKLFQFVQSTFVSTNMAGSEISYLQMCNNENVRKREHEG